MKTIPDYLRAARKRISNPQHWAKGFYAYDKLGNQIHGENDGAVSWCSLGVLEKEVPYELRGRCIVLLAKATNTSKELRHYVVAQFNDGHTHEEVLAMFDKAIKLAEEQ